MSEIILDRTDISPIGFKFNPHIGTSLRDRVRDITNTILRRPLYKLMYGRKFAHLPYRVDLVLPEKGMSTLACRHWVNRYHPLEGARILVIGCGTAWDFGSYLRFKPREIVGVDLYNFANCWQQVQDYVAQAGLPTKVTFYQVDIAELSNKIVGDFDVICSDAVFEHCKDFESILKTLYSLLRSGGVMYASYGPLWYSWGGDHFSGRGGIEQGYNHLLLDTNAYQAYYQSHVRDDTYELQNGGRYIKLDLFSKLSNLEYFNFYQKTGFCLKSVFFVFSVDAEHLRSTPIFNQLVQKFPQLTVADFLVKGHYVILGKQ